MQYENFDDTCIKNDITDILTEVNKLYPWIFNTLVRRKAMGPKI